MTSSWTVKNRCYKIRLLTLDHTKGSGRKRTVFKNLGCGTILEMRGEVLPTYREETGHGNSQ